MTEPALAHACALIVFFGTDPSRVTGRLRAVMKGNVRVSPVTVFEIAQKRAAGRLPPFADDHLSIVEILRREAFDFHPLTWADAERANALPPWHKDPMDRLLIAQALNAGLPVVTNDAVFARYGVETIW